MPDDDLERRLRAHLARVADAPPSSDLEGRVLDATEKPSRRATSWRATALVLAMVLLLVALFALVTAGQTSNVFSNISTGLGS